VSDDDWANLARWMCRGDGALLSAEELHALLADRDRLRLLVEDLRRERASWSRSRPSRS
jgi:hypothetical protein